MATQKVYGVIDHSNQRRTDYLYRISIKGLIHNNKGEVLVVKETGRDQWDLPGGGMDHNEGIKAAIARELHEEVGLEGDFTYTILDVEEPQLLTPHNFWQLRLIYEIIPSNMLFTPGIDGDAIAFINPYTFKDSVHYAERKVYDYATLAMHHDLVH